MILVLINFNCDVKKKYNKKMNKIRKKKIFELIYKNNLNLEQKQTIIAMQPTELLIKISLSCIMLLEKVDLEKFGKLS